MAMTKREREEAEAIAAEQADQEQRGVGEPCCDGDCQGHSEAAEDSGRPSGIVAAVDKLVEPLDQILHLMQKAAKLSVLLILTLIVLTGAQAWNIYRVAVMERSIRNANDTALEAKVAAEETKETVRVTAKTEASVRAEQNTVSLVATTDSSGKPSAAVIIRPPTRSAKAASSSIMLPVTLPVTAQVVKDGGPGIETSTTPIGKESTEYPDPFATPKE